jgi:uncharacterized protein DUF2569
MNDSRGEGPQAIGGWLLLLCVLLLVWGPVSLGLVAANALSALSVRGLSLAVVIAVRILVAAFGIAAGIALITGRGGAATLAKLALTLSAATDVIVYLTPYFPNNRIPGDTPFYVAVSLAYHGIWLAYLFRSKRVKNTYG